MHKQTQMTTPASKAQFSAGSLEGALAPRPPVKKVASGPSLSASSVDHLSDVKSMDRKPSDPLTVDEVKSAAERFFPLFDIILENMPEESKIEDCLKVMESVCTLAHKLRAEEKSKDKESFGFLKDGGE